MAQRVSASELNRRVLVGERDFSGANFQGSTMVEPNFADCSFLRADLRSSDISDGHFVSCNFDYANMYGCHIKNATFTRCSFVGTSARNSTIDGVQFHEGHFFQADMSFGYIYGTRFIKCDLDSLNIQRARLDNLTLIDCSAVAAAMTGAVFVNVDLQPFIDGARGRPLHSAVVDWQSICRTLNHPNLASFLLSCRMPEIFVSYSLECARALDPLLLRNLMRSTFICYGAPDVEFARLLRDRLHRNGVDTFFFETDAVPGTKLHHLMRNEVNNHDRVIVICSQASLTRAGVRNEIEETLAREARDGGAPYLVPVALDTFVFVWRDPLAQAIRDRVIGDFSGISADTPKFRSSFQLLLQALKKPA